MERETCLCEQTRVGVECGRAFGDGTDEAVDAVKDEAGSSFAACKVTAEAIATRFFYRFADAFFSPRFLSREVAVAFVTGERRADSSTVCNRQSSLQKRETKSAFNASLLARWAPKQ